MRHWLDKALEASVMSTHLLIRANITKDGLINAYKIAAQFEERYSAYQSNSFLNTINKQAGIAPVQCTLEDYTLFQRAIEASEMTHGIFDITIGALSHGAYHFGFTNQGLANKKIITKQKKLVNYKNIILTKHSIYLSKKGMRIDLGGIGKGYVAKLIAEFLVEQGATRILVDVGGEIITRGKSFSIAIQDPFDDNYRAIIKTTKEDTSISTSGNYERFIGSTQNHHILDKKKGTSSSYYSSISIMQQGWNIDLLDAYATALFNQPSNTLKSHCQDYNISIFAIDTQNNVIEENMQNIKLKSLKRFENY